MKQIVELKLLPKEAVDEQLILERAAKKCRVNPTKIIDIQYLKRSIDARGNRPFIRLRTEISTEATFSPEPSILSTFQEVSDSPEILIIGAGPAGYFAALECLSLGYKPVLLDRGKPVRERRRDLRAIQQFGQVHPDSNYCFGEGGAGTYSDGKLYTRSHKRGKIEKVLQLLVEHGAKSDILIDAHPHIGSNKLPSIVANIRASILQYGGEIHFGKRVNDFIIHNQKMIGVIANQKESYYAKAIVLATGHSARDIYQILHQKQIYIEAKPFALGVRIEHPQALIDEIQYNQRPREEHLPASSYKLVSQVKGRGVFSFCMCPGGLIVPAATAPGELVVNGMSLSRRDSAFANSGTVVGVELEDLKAYQQHGVFAALAFQKSVEQSVFQFGNGSQQAPAQRLEDFTTAKTSFTLPSTSYIPGIYAAPLHQLLPNSIYERLRQGVLDFGKKMKGYYTREAVVVGTESRTSSPIRIPRSRETYMHEQIEGLFPCGEGAGYAGGILSAAMDGQNVVKAVGKWMES